MHAPLARHLTRFGLPAVDAGPPPAVFEEPQVTLRAAELETRVETAYRRGRDEARMAAEETLAALRSEHDAALAAAAGDTAAAVAQARAHWAATQGEQLGAAIDNAFTTLAERLGDGLADALRPLLRAALLERTAAQLADALASVLGDRDDPPLIVRGPPDLLAALDVARAGRGGLDLQESDSAELVVIAAGARLETRFAAALAALAQEMA